LILGVDPGERRVGVALADPETRFARPLEVVDRSKTDASARIVELVARLGVRQVVVGRPLGLSGRPGPAAAAQQAFVEELRGRVRVPVVEFDERFTSVIAERSLRSAGNRRTRRRALADAVAAQVMLQDFLDAS